MLKISQSNVKFPHKIYSPFSTNTFKDTFKEMFRKLRVMASALKRLLRNWYSISFYMKVKKEAVKALLSSCSRNLGFYAKEDWGEEKEQPQG